DLVKTLLDNRNRATAGATSVDTSLLGIRYIAYGSYLGTTPGLQRWKKSNLFTPGLTFFDYRPAMSEMSTEARPRPVSRSANRITEGMISTGIYDAYDKWEVL